MAGLSSRFFNAGFDKPKYMLDLGGVSVFSKAVLSFEHYFNEEKFVFIIRNIYNTSRFVINEITKLGIEHYKIITLDHETNGQAETVFLATQKLESDEPIIIFNIDTFRKNYRKPEFIGECDGYLEVFSGRLFFHRILKPWQERPKRNAYPIYAATGFIILKARTLLKRLF